MGFPENQFQALTMLYLEKSIDFSKITPTELTDLYNKVYNEIVNRSIETAPTAQAGKRF